MSPTGRNKVTEAAAAWRALEPSQRERLISYIRGPWNGNEHQRIVDAALAVLRAAAEPEAKDEETAAERRYRDVER